MERNNNVSIFILHLFLRCYSIFLLIYHIITPIILNPYISIYNTSIHQLSISIFFNLLLFESQSLYSILFLAYPLLSFSIYWQFRILLIFLNLYILIHVNPFLSFLQYNSPLFSWIPIIICKSILRLFTSIIFNSLTIQPHFLNLYLLIHVNPFISFLQNESPAYPFESQSFYRRTSRQENPDNIFLIVKTLIAQRINNYFITSYKITIKKFKKSMDRYW